MIRYNRYNIDRINNKWDNLRFNYSTINIFNQLALKK